MLKTPMTLSLVALLAACGGGGTPAVDDTPEVPETSETPEEVVLEVPEEIAPDPVTFVFDTSDQVDFTLGEDSFVFDGETYQMDDLRFVLADGNSAMFSSAPDKFNPGLSLIRILDDDASIALAVLVPDPGLDTSYIAAPRGTSVTIPTLDTAPVGEATFQGDYIGFIMDVGPFNGNGSPQNDRVNSFVFGDVTLEVEFADYLSQSTVSGIVENREFRDFDDGEENPGLTLNDMIIENGRFDDTGQLIADVSGGEYAFIDPLGIYNEPFTTTPGTLNGQLGGSDGTVVTGTLDVVHHRYVLGPEPDFDLILDEFQYALPEIGAFVARQD